jgi:hypothetical protein
LPTSPRLHRRLGPERPYLVDNQKVIQTPYSEPKKGWRRSFHHLYVIDVAQVNAAELGCGSSSEQLPNRAGPLAGTNQPVQIRCVSKYSDAAPELIELRLIEPNDAMPGSRRKALYSRWRR